MSCQTFQVLRCPSTGKGQHGSSYCSNAPNKHCFKTNVLRSSPPRCCSSARRSVLTSPARLYERPFFGTNVALKSNVNTTNSALRRRSSVRVLAGRGRGEIDLRDRLIAALPYLIPLFDGLKYGGTCSLCGRDYLPMNLLLHRISKPFLRKDSALSCKINRPRSFVTPCMVRCVDVIC
jgi:hypothetical protein